MNSNAAGLDNLAIIGIDLICNNIKLTSLLLSKNF